MLQASRHYSLTPVIKQQRRKVRSSKPVVPASGGRRGGWGALQSTALGSPRGGSFHQPEEAGGVPVVLEAPGGLQDAEGLAALGQRQAPRQAQAPHTARASVCSTPRGAITTWRFTELVAWCQREKRLNEAQVAPG